MEQGFSEYEIKVELGLSRGKEIIVHKAVPQKKLWVTETVPAGLGGRDE